MVGLVFKQLSKIFKDSIDINLTYVLKNISWLFMANFIRVLSSFFVGILIVRHLGVNDYGIYTLTLSIASIFGVFAALGLKETVILELGSKNVNESEIIISTVTLLLFSGVLTYALLLISIHTLFPLNKELFFLVSIYGSTLLFKFPEVAEYWFEAKLQSKYFAIIQTSFLLIFAIIKLALVIFEADLVHFVLIVSLEILVSLLTLFIIFLRKGPNFFLPKKIISTSKRLLKFSWPLLLSSLSVILYIRIDQIMLGKIIGTEELGLYGSATKIIETTYFLPTIIAASFFPYLINKHEENIQLFNKEVERLFGITFVLSLGLSFCLYFFADVIVKLLYGDDFAMASPVLRIYSWMIVFTFWGVISGKIFLVHKRPLLHLERTLLGLLINIIFNTILIPTYGGVGAAYATLIANVAAAYLFDFFRKDTRYIFFIKTRSINIFKLWKI